MKKIALISDIHGNYPALEALLEAIKGEGVDEIICLGDTLAIGPQPYECITRLLHDRVTLVNGNHETYFIEGVDAFPEVGPGERSHQKWVASLLNDTIKSRLKDLPLILYRKIGGRQMAFTHYSTKKGRFVYSNQPRTSQVLDDLFSEVQADLILYGHEHEKVHQVVKGRAEYICLGSSACSKKQDAHYSLVTYDHETYTLEEKRVAYDFESFYAILRAVDFPEKAMIMKSFYGLSED